MASIEFLNLDLDLESNVDLTLLLEEFGESVVVMNHDQGELNKLSLELAGVVGRPDDLILEYAKLVENLTEPARKVWDACSKREVDVGFECEGSVEGSPIGLTERLSLESIVLLSKLKMTITITIYSVPA